MTDLLSDGHSACVIVLGIMCKVMELVTLGWDRDKFGNMRGVLINKRHDREKRETHWLEARQRHWRDNNG